MASYRLPAQQEARVLLRYLLDHQARHGGRLPTLSLMGQKLGYLSADKGIAHAKEVLAWLEARGLVVPPRKLSVDTEAARAWLEVGK